MPGALGRRPLVSLSGGLVLFGAAHLALALKRP